MELMTGKREHINVLLLDIDGNMTDCLNRVGVEKHALFAAEFSDFRNRLNCSDFVVCIHYSNKAGIVRNCLFNILNTDNTVIVNIKVGDGEALLFKRGHCVENGVVFNLGGDEVLFAFFCAERRSTLDCPVVRFRAARGEKDFPFVCAERRGNLSACLCNCPVSRLTYGIKA